MAPTTENPKPDSGLDLGEKAGLWYENNSRLITIALAAVVIGVLGVRLYHHMNEGKIERVSAEFAPVMDGLSAALNETDESKRRDKLMGTITEADHVASLYPDMTAGKSALLAIGNAHYYLAANMKGAEAQAELKNARTAYEKYITAATASDEKAAGQLALANTLENLFFITKDATFGQDATKFYEEVEKILPSSYLAAEAKLGQGRLLEAQAGKQDAAKKVFEDLAAERKIDLSAYAKEKPIKSDKGIEISADDIAKLKASQPDSYEIVAQKSLSQLNGLPTGK